MTKEDAAGDVGVVDALSVYLEPLANDAHVLVVGDLDGALATRLEELGARSVRAEYESAESRKEIFDLAVIPDLSALDDPAAAVTRLRRLVDARGAVVAMGRARNDAGEDERDAFPELAPATLGYAELYDLFAIRFEHVAMTGVVPFRGVVFAELGHEEADVGVSVDTRLAEPPPPSVFVVVASREPCPLEPYAIVQVGSESAPRRDLEAEAAFAAMHLKAELLAAQLDEQRMRLAAAEARTSEAIPRVEIVVRERDAATTRARELEDIANAAQQAIAMLERRLLAAEQGMLERDDRIAALHAELDAGRARGDAITPEEASALLARCERTEAALALHVADLAQLSEAHAEETAALERQLRERAKVITALEKEILRREQLVRELVSQIEEAGAGANGHTFAAPPSLATEASSAEREEIARLKKKLDELALEVARREGELKAQAWKIQELESGGGRGDLERELGKTRDEVDALRQALIKEHALVEQLKNPELGRGG